MSLAELEERQKRLMKELAEVEQAIASQPETFKGLLPDAPDDLIAQIDWMEPSTEWTDSRKNPVECNVTKYRFKGDDQVYEYWNGENWCSQTCEVVGKETEEISFNWLYETWEAFTKEHDQGPKTDELTRAEIMKQPRHLAVGYLLRWAEGW